MIPLVLRADFEDPAGEPFVVRLGAAGGPGAASLAGDVNGVLYYQAEKGCFGVRRPDDAPLSGDVVFANPAAGTIHRWLRAGSAHNTLLVTERCDQLCQMCSQPPRKTHVDLFGHLEEACLLADTGACIGFSGGEPLLYKEALFSLLERVGEQRPDLSFHVLTNGQHFDRADAPRLRQPVFQRVLWGVPLYSAGPALHDEIVVKQGAFARLMESFALLARTGQSIELRTVLLRSNYPGLPEMARMVADRLPFIATWAIMQLERSGFARNRWNTLFVDHSAEPGPLEQAVALAAARGIETALFNMPYCTVGPRLRRYLHASISDWKRAFPEECKDCSARALCGGFFAWHPSLKDYARGGALT